MDEAENTFGDTDDERPDFCLHFPKSTPEKVVQSCLTAFRTAGIISHVSADNQVVLLRVPPELLEKEAETCQLRKWHTKQLDMVFFSCAEKHLFSDRPPNKLSTKLGLILETNDPVDSTKLFASSERSYLAECVINRVRVDETFHKLYPSSRRDESYVHALERLDLITGFDPLHLPTERAQLWRRFWTTIVTPPSRNLRDYFGESVSYYFAWMSFYTKSLLFPGMLAVILWSLSQIMGYSTVDRNPYVPFYTLSVMIWGFIFVKFWQRRANQLALVWETYDFIPQDDLNPDFEGILRPSPITGKMELYFPHWKRRVRYGISALVTGGMLIVAFLTMLGSLNLQGYVDKETRFGDANPFYVGFLNAFAQPGAIFDPNGSSFLSFIPPILHSTVIFILNQLIYRQIATYLTKCENHRTRSDFDRSLFLKRFLFDAFDSYIALFYLAFYEYDIDELSNCLTALYMTDSIRRILLESVIPLIMFYFRSNSDQVIYNMKKKLDDLKPTSKQDNSRQGPAPFIPYKEILADEYEEFDDYLEMVIQYGYIILFASACPLASIFSVLTSLVEVKADAFKLMFVTKRPRVRRVTGIGIWTEIISAITWFSILTNVFIFGLSSEQMMQWFPWFYQRISVFDPTTHQQMLEQELREGAGRYVLGFMFLLEHVLIIMGLVIHFAIEDTPKTTKVAIAARDYRKNQIYLQSIVKKIN